MSFNRRFRDGAEWAIAAGATGLGVFATLIVTNAIIHAGWSRWFVVVCWIAIIGMATLFIKLRHSSPPRPQPRRPGDALGGNGCR